jgi:hypothetical protein
MGHSDRTSLEINCQKQAKSEKIKPCRKRKKNPGKFTHPEIDPLYLRT